MTRRKLAVLRERIRVLRFKESVTNEEIQRLLRAVRRKRQDGDVWVHRVLAERMPLTVPRGKTIKKNAAQAVLDVLSGDLDAYEETFEQQTQPKNGHQRR
jgi:hypothetical protein